MLPTLDPLEMDPGINWKNCGYFSVKSQLARW